MIGRFQGSLLDRRNDIFTIKRLRMKAVTHLSALRAERAAIDRSISTERAWLRELKARERAARKITEKAHGG